MTYKKEFIENVRNSSDIVEIISDYVELKQSGQNLIGRCPFHNDKTPSFTITPEKQMFYCFGCKVGGNVYNFIMEIENLSFPEAVEYLADKAGIPLPQSSFDSTEIARQRKIRNIIYEIQKDAANYFYCNLIKKESGKHVLDYLFSRGLSYKIIKKFGLGYSAPNWDATKKHLLIKGYNEKMIELAGLIIKGKHNNYYDRFRDRIMFPITDSMGKAIGFGGRSITDTMPKYLNTSDTPIYNKRENLYGISFAKRECKDKGMIVVEGYIDVIMLHQEGFTNTVASLGTALTVEQAKLIKRFTDTVYLAYDSDESGKAATLKGMEILNDVGLIVKIVILPEGLDPDDYIRHEGKCGFQKKIEQALPIMDYKLMRLKEGYNMSSPSDKKEYISSIAPHIIKIKSFVEKDAYIRKISEDLGIREESLRMDIHSYTSQNQSYKTMQHKKAFKTHNNKNGVKYTIESSYLNAEIDLINLLVNEEHTYGIVRENDFNVEDFIDDTNRKIAKTIYDIKYDQKEISPAEIVDKLPDAECVKRFSHIMTRNSKYTDIRKITIDCIKIIKKYKLQQKLDKIQRSIKAIETSNEYDEHELNKLLVRYQEILKRKK